MAKLRLPLLGLFSASALLALAGAGAARAEGDCQPAKISCSDAMRQNQAFCAGPRRAESGMTQEGCLKSGERAMQDCLKTGRWVTGKRNLCELEKR